MERVDGQVPIKGALADEIVDQIVTEEILEDDLETEITGIEEITVAVSRKDFKGIGFNMKCCYKNSPY